MLPRKRLLFCHYSGQDLMRGSERVAEIIVKQLISRGHKVIVLTNSPALVKAVSGVATECRETSFASRKDITTSVRLGQTLIMQHQIDIIHANSGMAIKIAQQLRIGLHCTVVGHLHAPYGILDRIRYGFHYADRLIAVSHNAATGLHQWVARPDRLDIVHNPVMTKGGSRKSKIGSDIELVCCSSLSYEKGVDRVVLMMQSLPAKVGDHLRVRLTIVGDGPERTALEAMAQNLPDPSQVRFVGHSENPDEYYQQADLLVVGSRRESFGLVAIEAALFSVPTVAPEIGGLSEVIHHGSSGWLVPDPSPTAMADSCARLILDEPLRTELGKTARRTAIARFSVNQFTDRLEQIYQSAQRSFNPSPVGVNWIGVVCQLISNQYRKRLTL